jgi:hypothetical protein
MVAVGLEPYSMVDYPNEEGKPHSRKSNAKVLMMKTEYSPKSWQQETWFTKIFILS